MTTNRSDLSTFRVASGVLALLVLVQATLAGQFLNATSGALAPHRIIGEFLGLLALVVAYFGYRLRTDDPTRWSLGIALVVMVVAQTGLGFAGRDASGAAAVHIPFGVATFGVALIGALPRWRS